jgi:hypothetical protein
MQVRKQQLAVDIAPWWIAGSLLEISWLYLYGEATKQTFAMASLALIYASFAFTLALFAVEPPNAPKVFTRDGTVLVAAASAINAAWLSVAAAVGILMILPAPTEQVELAAVLVGCVAGIGLFISLRTASIAYPLTLVWAFVAVTLVGERSRTVRVIAGVAAGVSAMVAVVNVMTRLFGSMESSKQDKDDDDKDDDEDDDDADGDEKV